MCACRARRNAKLRADLLVRSTRRYEPHDLDLAAGEAGDALRHRSRRWPRPELAQLLARRIELTLCAEMREHFVRPTQLACRAFAIAGFRQRSRELSSQSRR